MVEKIMEYRFGAHPIDWQVLFVVLFCVHMFLAWQERQSRAWKLAFGIAAAASLTLVIRLV